MKYSIELDCQPGYIRPGDLLPKVLEGTGIVLPAMPNSMAFGNWLWDIPEDQVKLYLKHRELIKSRFQALYNTGQIRYGSW